VSDGAFAACGLHGPKPFGPALLAIQSLHSAKIVSGDAEGHDAIPFREIAETPEIDAVEAAFAAVTPDTIAKFLFHLGFDRNAEGGHQHPAHADLEPAGQGTDLVVSRWARRSGDSRLAALEPYLRRQPQFQTGAAQWRHALYRQRQAGAGPVRDLARQSAQRDADGVFQRAAVLEDDGSNEWIGCAG